MKYGVSVLCVVLSLAASTSAAEPRVQVRNTCILGDNTLLFHVVFDVAYAAKTSRPAYRSRQLYQFKCDLPSSVCSGMRLTLDELDNGGPLTYTALDEIGPKATLIATGSTFLIKWPTLRTFALDFSGHDGALRYVESGQGLIAGAVEGRASSTCELTDVRHCEQDEDCLPANKCSQNMCLKRRWP